MGRRYPSLNAHHVYFVCSFNAFPMSLCFGRRGAASLLPNEPVHVPAGNKPAGRAIPMHLFDYDYSALTGSTADGDVTIYFGLGRRHFNPSFLLHCFEKPQTASTAGRDEKGQFCSPGAQKAS